MAIEIVGGKSESPQELTTGSILRGSEYASNLISGSPALEPPPTELTHHENFGVFRGIAWSLVFEGTAAAACYALWQVWKMLR